MTLAHSMLHALRRRLRYMRSGLPLAMAALLCGHALHADAATVNCTGWGTDTARTVTLNLPTTLTVPVGAAVGSELASGVTTLTALTCTDGGQAVANSDWRWAAGSGAAAADLRTLAPGIGLRLTWLTSSAATGTLPAGGGGQNTLGLGWTQLKWSLIRSPGTAATGSLLSGGLPVTEGTLSLSDGTMRTLTLNSNGIVLVAACEMQAIPTITLPTADASALNADGHGASSTFSAKVACPADVRVAGMTLTLSTAAPDGVDNALIANTGDAGGVAIEVLAGGKRVSAQRGAVTQQVAFTNAASQDFEARIVRVPNGKVSAGTVRGTGTLTLTLN